MALCLHGAMTAQGYDDPEGDLIARIRDLVGPDVPIAAGLDPHRDPVAVRLCAIAGEGARAPLRFGAKSAPGCGEPIDAMVLVKRIVPDARQTFGQSIVPFGDAVLIEVGGVEVILNSIRSQAFERTVFTAMGVDPTQKAVVVVVKSTNHFHADFSKFAAKIIYCRGRAALSKRSADHRLPQGAAQHLADRRGPVRVIGEATVVLTGTDGQPSLRV